MCEGVCVCVPVGGVGRGGLLSTDEGGLATGLLPSVLMERLGPLGSNRYRQSNAPLDSNDKVM